MWAVRSLRSPGALSAPAVTGVMNLRFMSMNESEVHEQIVANIELINASFEFWITGTFAVLVACHFAAEKISPYLYRLIALLYSLLTLTTLLRLFNGTYAAAEYIQRLSELGLPPYPNTIVGAAGPVAHFFMIVIGFFGTLIFAKKSAVSDESNT